CEQLLDRGGSGISERCVAAIDGDRFGGIDSDGLKIGVKQPSRIDLAIDHRGAGFVGLAENKAAWDPRTTHDDRPAARPMVPATVEINVRRAAEFREYNN